jgi:aminopeptidase N
MTKRSSALVIVALAVSSCTQNEPPVNDGNLARDYFTFANTDQIVTEHLELDLTIDFDAEQLYGSATLHLQRTDSGAKSVILDTRDLTIEGASFALSSSEPIIAEYSFGETDAVMGTPLIVKIPEDLRSESNLSLKIDYRTSPGSTALQWLPPNLTAGGEHPFLFSQSQAIHARSWIPLQDTPAVRITYEAVIHTPPELLALMSAINDPSAARDGTYEFEMPQPIPAYLLAIAVGDISFASIGDQTGIYAEPETLEAAAYEFGDTQAMLESAEELFGPYKWGRYDLLILPPSFPYGGMENPRLSFLTPSLLAGDRSLVSVVAHELAHSWSGNLVTNATWRDVWLNEGITSYLEWRLMEVIYSKARAAEENVLDYRTLLRDFEQVAPELQALAPSLETGDPDDPQGMIPYHKGNLFLQYLENAFGRDAFDEFLGNYFNDFAFQTITSEQFLDYLDEKLFSIHPGPIGRAQAEQWVYEPGLPDDALIPHSELLAQVSALATAWSKGEIDIEDVPIANWSPQAMVHFINSLDADLSEEKLGSLDAALDLSDTPNAVVGRAWFIQVAKRRHLPAYDKLEQHLNRFGRIWLIHPVYKALSDNGFDRALAKEMFERARENYHPLTVMSIESVL